MELLLYSNEIAIVGVACLSIALGTIWYSLPLFKEVQTAHSVVTNTKRVSNKNLFVPFVFMFVSYVGILWVLSFLATIANILSLSYFFFPCMLLLFSLLLLTLVTFLEDKSIHYFFMHAGFLCILILCGSYVMVRWPW